MIWPPAVEEYLKIIDSVPLQYLRDESYMEHLLQYFGVNAEDQAEQMPSYFLNVNSGLRIWQYPKQFSKYLVWLSYKDIKSYLEIGTRYGGTFLVTLAYLSRFNKIEIAAGIDLNRHEGLLEFSKNNPFANFVFCSTEDSEFIPIVSQEWDLILVDGDHTFPVLRNDWERTKHAKYVAFHDIVNAKCPDVISLWDELKRQYNHVEFTDQYHEVFHRTNSKFLGLGVIQTHG